MHGNRDQTRTPARGVRITLATGKHRWTFDVDQTGRDTLDTALHGLSTHSELSFTETDALIVRRAVAEGLGLIPQIRSTSTQDRPPTGR